MHLFFTKSKTLTLQGDLTKSTLTKHWSPHCQQQGLGKAHAKPQVAVKSEHDSDSASRLHQTKPKHLALISKAVIILKCKDPETTPNWKRWDDIGHSYKFCNKSYYWDYHNQTTDIILTLIFHLYSPHLHISVSAWISQVFQIPKRTITWTWKIMDMERDLSKLSENFKGSLNEFERLNKFKKNKS